MRLRSTLFLALAIALTLFVVGCEETNDPADQKPVLAAGSISIPAFSSDPTDTCGPKAYMYASEVQAFIALANAYANPALMTQVNGVWTYSLTENGLTLTITASKQSDGAYRWLVKLNGVDATDGTVYTNWTAMEANATVDGKSGSLIIYSEYPTPGTNVDVSFTWSTGANNMVTYDLQVPQENVRFVLLSNGTRGEVTEYVRASSTAAWVANGYHAVWTSAGGVPAC